MLLLTYGVWYLWSVYPKNWSLSNQMSLVSFGVGLYPLAQDTRIKYKIFNEIKKQMKFCNLCGTRFDIKESKECDDCKYNLSEIFEMTYSRKIAIKYLIFFGSIESLFIIINTYIYISGLYLSFSKLYFWIFVILFYLKFFGIVIYDFMFVVKHHRLIENNLVNLKRSLNFCINCGNTLEGEIIYECNNCGYIFSLEKLEEFY